MVEQQSFGRYQTVLDSGDKKRSCCDSLKQRGGTVLCVAAWLVSRRFSAMPEIREMETAECGCHRG